MTIYAKSGTTIHIGRVGENLATDVVFDISTWVEEYGQGTAGLVINQNGETYPQYTTREDNLIKWKVTNSNTSDAGMGKCELFYLVDEIKVKSAIYDFIVTNSLDYEEGAEPPAPFESWVEDVIENAVFIKENIARSEENADTAEAWAVGEKNGQPLEEGDEQYNNNSKYYSVQSETWAEGNPEDESKSAKDWAIGLNEEVDDYSSRYHAVESKNSSLFSKSWAIGETGARDGEDTNNSKYYAGQASDSAVLAEQWAEGTFEDGSKSAKEWSIESQNWRLESESFAVGERNGVQVDETDKTFENNAKYYKNMAEKAFSDAIVVKNDAITAKVEAEAARDAAKGAKGDAEKAQGLAKTAKDAAEAAKDAAKAAQSAAETAKDLAEEAEIETKAARDKTIEIRDNVILINSNPPYMSTETGNWVVYNKEIGDYADSGVKYFLSIARSYSSVAEMNADVANMKDGDLVIIASDINEEDNSKLFVHDGTKWIYLSDLSGFQGVGIARIERTAGNGAAGTTDTYTIFLTDNRTYDFTVYNGANGTGVGDMVASVYDKNGNVLAAGGIDEYVKENTPTILLKDWTMDNINN